jgi:hypothetical protein
MIPADCFSSNLDKSALRKEWRAQRFYLPEIDWQGLLK